jgi:hypothetical protein
MYVIMYVCIYVCMYVCVCMYVYMYVYINYLCMYYVCMYITMCFLFCVMKSSQNILRLQFGQPEALTFSMHVVRKHTNFPIISGSPFLCYIGNNQS